MIRLRLSAEDLSRIRFAFSPLWETVTSLRTLTGRHELHRPWVRQVSPVLRNSPVDLALLTALVRPAGYIPDFLVPSPDRRDPTFAAELARVGAADLDAVATQLRHLADHPVAQAGPGREARVRVIEELAADPDRGLARVLAELDAYWQVAVAPYWPRITGLLQADLAYRLEEMAAGGVQRLFEALHPRVSFERDEVRVVKYWDGTADLGGRGLLLVPCAFAWPDVIVLTAEPGTPTLSYSPRGLGRLWETAASQPQPGLSEVLGRTRASLLAQLDLPMSTTQLASLLELSAPTLNAHLKALQGAGMLTSRRDGRAVLYARTDLSESLLAAGGRTRP